MQKQAKRSLIFCIAIVVCAIALVVFLTQPLAGNREDINGTSLSQGVNTDVENVNSGSKEQNGGISVSTIPLKAGETGGNGGATQTDPLSPANAIYISTEAELRGIADWKGEEGYFALANDIQLKSEWNPIEFFTGILDGRGHTISGFYTAQGWGLFRSAGNAEIKNLDINISQKGISGSIYAGALIGSIQGNQTISIVNCHITGGSVSANNYAGGLIGYVIGAPSLTIKDSSTECTVSASEDMAVKERLPDGIFAAGGLIGNIQNHAYSKNYEIIIESSSATGDISASAISKPEANATSVAMAGGLIGRYLDISPDLACIIKDCYSIGNVSATESGNGSFAGGLFGFLEYTCPESRPLVINCYATGDVYAKGASDGLFAGGLIGICLARGIGPADDAYTVLRNCYRLETQAINGKQINSDGAPIAPDQLRALSTLPRIGWDFNSTWECKNGANNGYPVLKR